MNPSSPISDIIPSAEGAVLQVLARVETGLSGRAVAELTGSYGHTQVGKTLKKLQTAGVVHVDKHRSAHIYYLNREHVAANAIVALASLKETAIDRMRTFAATMEPAPDAVWLFGSFARGSGHTGSDIDIIAIRPETVAPDDPAWMEALSGFSESTMALTGNQCTVLDLTASEFDDLIEHRERLPTDIARDGIELAGARIPRTRKRQTAQ